MCRRDRLSGELMVTRSMKTIRRLQSFAAPVVATFGVNPGGRNAASAASGTLKSSWNRVSLLLSIGVSARAPTVNNAFNRTRKSRFRMRALYWRRHLLEAVLRSQRTEFRIIVFRNHPQKRLQSENDSHTLR